MENKETITTLKGISEKESKAGRKYFSVQTDEGSMTMFDKPIIDEMMKHVGKKVRLEYAEKDGFKNVKKFLGEVGEEKVSENPGKVAPGGVMPKENFEEARKLKDQSIYTSYAKDLFIAMLDHKGSMEKPAEIVADTKTKAIMQEAIALVKIARDAFAQ